MAADLVGRWNEFMESRDIEALADLYSPTGRVIRFSSVAVGRNAIADLFRETLTMHGWYRVTSLEQYQDAGDLLMWDATVDTARGLLLTTHVVVLEPGGLISHHVPGVRGYWGM